MITQKQYHGSNISIVVFLVCPKTANLKHIQNHLGGSWATSKNAGHEEGNLSETRKIQEI